MGEYCAGDCGYESAVCKMICGVFDERFGKREGKGKGIDGGRDMIHGCV